MRNCYGLVALLLVASLMFIPVVSADKETAPAPATRQGGNETWSLVHGRILDADTKEPVYPATLVNGTGVVPPVANNEDGSYAIYNLTEGRYLFDVSAEGYEAKTVQVLVFKNSTVDFDIELQVEGEKEKDFNIMLWIGVGMFMCLVLVLIVVYIITADKKKAAAEGEGKDEADEKPAGGKKKRGGKRK